MQVHSRKKSDIGKSFKKLRYSNSTDLLQANCWEPPSFANHDRKNPEIYKSPLCLVDRDNKYLDGYPNHNNSQFKTGSHHQRTISDLPLCKESYSNHLVLKPEEDRYTLKQLYYRGDTFGTFDDDAEADQDNTESEYQEQRKEQESLEQYKKPLNSTRNFLESIDQMIYELTTTRNVKVGKNKEKIEITDFLKLQNRKLKIKLRQAEQKIRIMQKTTESNLKKEATRDQIQKTKFEQMLHYISDLKSTLQKQRQQKINLALYLKNLQHNIDLIHKSNQKINVQFGIDSYVKRSVHYETSEFEQSQISQPERTGVIRHTVNPLSQDTDNISRGDKRIRKNLSINKGSMYF